MTTEEERVMVLLNEAKVFMSITGPGKDVMKAVFQTFYASPHMSSNNGQMTIREYQQQVKLSDNQLKGIFKREMTSILDIDLIQSDLDITFYYAAISQLNTNAYNRLDTKSHGLLKRLKDERNKLAHNADFLDQPLPDKLRDLESLYEDVLIAFEREFPGSPYLQDARVTVPSLTVRIRNEKTDIIDQYLRDREKFMEDLQNEIVCKGQNELGNDKRFGNSTDPFQKLLELRRIDHQNTHPIKDVFTPPWIQEGQQKTPHETLLEVQDTYGQLPRVTFVAGQGGSGKSTLIHKIFTEWQNRGKIPPDLKLLGTFDLIFDIELKHICSNSLSDLLEKELLVNTLQRAKWGDVFPILNNLNILFLIDGFDESNDDGKQLVREIARRLPSSRILLTTRPEFLKEAQNIFQNSSSVTLNLHGFDKDNQKMFARKILKLTEKDTNVALKHGEFCDFLNRRGIVLKTHLELPLTMALLILLWLEYQSTPERLETINTATQLYQQLFLMLKEKLVRVRTLFAAVPEDAVERILHHLRGAALQQLSFNVFLQLSEKSYTSITEKCLENDLSGEDMEREFMSAFIVYNPDAIVRPKNKAKKLMPKPPYAFFHRTQMEYFGAEHAVGELTNKNMTLKDSLTHSDKRRYKEVFPFIAGCLSNTLLLELHCEELISLSEEANVHETDFNFWFQLISETSHRDPTFGDTSFSRELSCKVADKLPDRSWKLKAETLISGLSLLIHCETVQIKELEIDIRINADPNDITDLDIILQKAKKVLGKRFGQCKITLSLHIRDHSMNYKKDRTDRFLGYFTPWTQIVKFTGHLGPAAVQHLTACKMIDVKLTSLDGFNSFMKQWRKFQKLKQLTITANFMDSLEEQQVCPIPSEWSCVFRILFYSVTDSSLDRIISFIKKSTSNGNTYSRLGVHKSPLGYTEGVRLFASLQNMVTEKVTVESPGTDLSDEEASSILAEALSGSDRVSTFGATWNKRDIRE